MPFLGNLAAYRLYKGILWTACGLVLTLSPFAQAGTIVRISTTVGDFSIELLPDEAPLTVQNFLNYVNRGDYNQTFIHRAEDSFVVQGGGFSFKPFVGPISVPLDPPVPNEFNVSNTRGTLAMAKFGDDPDSATSQWFVNLMDNSENLDNTNGGFTVFANVLGDGMEVLDAINNLSTILLSQQRFPTIPYVTDAYTDPFDFVYLNMEVVDRFSEAINVYESSSTTLTTSIDVNDGVEVYSLNMSLIEDGANIVFQVNSDSIIKLRSAPAGTATYSTSDNRLRFPSIEANLNGSVQTITNVVMVLSDLDDLILTLESFDE
jgi:peptidyl-prolyl cis-trans isomerase A (cyclophilin A)